MYNVLIVDDEAPARNLLKMKVDWNSINCKIIGMCKNGKEALDFYMSNHPDLVITDIQMPVMDGLKLIELIKEHNENQPIIILSCHESFSYARKAIKLGVNDYLIKDSFNTEELYAILANIFTEEVKNDLIIERSIDLDKINKSVIIKNLVHKEIRQSLCHEYIKRYKLNLFGKGYIVLYLDIEILNQDITNINKRLFNEEEIISLLVLIQNSIDEIGSGEVCHDFNNNFVIIYNLNESHSHMEIIKIANQLSNHIRQRIKNIFNVHTTIGVSNPFNNIENLNTAYKQSKYSSERKIINGYNRTYFYNSSSTVDEKQYINFLNLKLNQIKEYLYQYQFDTLKRSIKVIFLQNLNGFMQYHYVKHTNWNLLSMFIEFCSKKNISFNEICDSASPWEVIMDIKTIEGMCNWHIKIIENIQLRITPKNKENTYSYYVQKSIDYIHKNYMNNISLSDISKKYNINNSYLSRLFKKETGSNLIDYINNYRIEKAKYLIQNTNKKMYEIASLTGFNSTQRFYLIFKKIMGISPGDFRKN